MWLDSEDKNRYIWLVWVSYYVGYVGSGSGAGTNLKVGGIGPERKWRRTEKHFCRAPLLFGSTSSISRFGERFCDGQYSLVSFLFAVPSHL